MSSKIIEKTQTGFVIKPSLKNLRRKEIEEKLNLPKMNPSIKDVYEAVLETQTLLLELLEDK